MHARSISAVLALVLAVAGAAAALTIGVEVTPAPTKFRDDPAAHAIYDTVLQAMQQAEALSWKSAYTLAVDGQEQKACTYRI